MLNSAWILSAERLKFAGGPTCGSTPGSARQRQGQAEAEADGMVRLGDCGQVADEIGIGTREPAGTCGVIASVAVPAGVNRAS